MIGRKGDKPEKQQKPVREPNKPKVKADKNAGTGMTLAPRREGGIPVGQAPRATLMPPEVGVRKRVATVRRRAILAVLLAIAIAVVGTVGAFAYAATRTVQLAGAEAETLTILQKQQEFSDVRSADITRGVLEDAQRYATSTEILWMPTIIDKLYAIVPEGVLLGAYSLEGSTPVAAFAEPTVPLHAPRMASANLTVRAADLAAVEAWVERMPEVDGIVDAYLTDATREEEFGEYELHIAVYIDERALSYRFDPDAAEVADAADDAPEESEGEPLQPEAPETPSDDEENTL